MDESERWLNQRNREAHLWNTDPVYRAEKRAHDKKIEYQIAFKEWHKWDEILKHQGGNKFPKPTLENSRWRPFSAVESKPKDKKYIPLSTIPMLDDPHERQRVKDLKRAEEERIEKNRQAALKRKKAKAPLTDQEKNIIKANYAKVQHPPFIFETDCRSCRDFLLDEIQSYHEQRCLIQIYEKDPVQPTFPDSL